MEGTGGSSPPKNACEKIYEAVSVCPAFQAIRRSSSRPKYPRSASPSPKSSLPTPPANTIEIHFKPDSPKLPQQVDNSRPKHGAETAEVISINFDYSSQISPNEKPKSSAPAKAVSRKASFEASAAAASTNIVPKANGKLGSPQVGNEKGSKRTGVHIEDSFTDYINRTRRMIGRTISNVGGGKNSLQNGDEKAVGKDHFTDFIDRARKKFTTSLSIGGGKSNSFK